MSLTHGLTHHDGDDDLPVHHGQATKAGGALTRLSMRGCCGARKFALIGGKVRGVTGNLTEGFTGQSDGEVRPTTMNRGGGGSLM
jgi:hypothetical protein